MVNSRTGSVKVIYEDDKKNYSKACTAIAANISLWGNNNNLLEILQGQKSIRQMLEPRSRKDVVKRAWDYAQSQPEISRAITDKRNFAAAKFETYSSDEKQKKWVDDLCAALNYDEFIRKAFKTLKTAQVVPYIYRYFDKKDYKPDEFPDGNYVPRYIYILPPQDVEIVKSLGDKKLLWDIQDQAIRKWAKGQHLTPQEEWQAKEAVEPMRVAISTNKLLDLDALKDYGFGWGLITDDDADWDDGPIPSMKAIFADLLYLQICKDMEFNAIMQHKVGFVQITKGNPTPTKDSPVVKLPQLEELKTEISKQINNKMPTLFTSADVNIKWIAPPMELFSTEKYTKAEQRVKNWLGMPSEMWGGNSEKGSYASAYMSSKPIKQEVLTDRDIVQRHVESFFFDLCIKNKVGKERVHVKFDQNVFKEDMQVLSEEQFLQEQAISSVKSTLDAFGRDEDYEVKQRAKELKDNIDVFQPFFDKVKGLNDPGRPTTTNEPTPDKTLRTPRRTSAELSAELELLQSTEITESTIRIPVVPEDQRDDFKEFKTVSMGKGIKAIIGIPKGHRGRKANDESRIVTFIFDRKNWTLEKAQGKVEELKGGDD
jgi:hypothetical protein